MVFLIHEEAFLPSASNLMRLSAAAICSLGGTKTLILTDECGEELFPSGWHHTNKRGEAGIIIYGDEANHVQHKRHEPKDIEPSDQRIGTIALIPLIDYGNIEVSSIKPARFQAASRKTPPGRISHSFPAPTKVRRDEG